MKLFKTFLVVMAALVTAVIAAPLAQAGNSTPAERALEIRSEGMSQLCSNPTLSREAYRAVCGSVGAGNQPTRLELRALDVRARGMNQLCSSPTLSREAYRAVCGSAGAGNQPTRAELDALQVRGQGMNHLCDKNDLPSAEAFAALCGGQTVAATQIVPVEAASGFDWSDFGIGAGAMLGLVLLAGGILLGVHYGRRGSARPRPVS
jgi:hypothetical protein